MNQNFYHQFENPLTFSDIYIKRNWVTKFNFSWINPLIEFSSANKLNISNIFEVRKQEQSNWLHARFSKALANSFQASNLTWSFFKSAIIAFKYEWVIIILFRIMDLVLTLYNPIIFKHMITMYSDRSNTAAFTKTMLEYGVWLLLLNVFSVVSDFYENWLKAKFENSISSVVYQHIFRHPFPLRPPGEMVTMIQIDTAQITQLVHDGITFLLIPYSVTGAIYVYYNLIGPMATIGVFAVVLDLCASLIYGKVYATMQREIMSARDSRIKGLQEILAGIATIKQNDYYTYFSDKIRHKRHRELVSIRNQACLAYFMNFLLQYIRVSALLLTFYFSSEFSLAAILLIMSSYKQLSTAVNTIPGTISKCLFALTSIDRTMSFLSKSRPAKSLVRTDEATAVILNEQSFRYPEKTVKARRDHANVHDLLSEEKNQLKDISMKIQPGETVLIYGSNGSGKSSLLYSILGELVSAGGSQVNDSISIATQEPWLIQGTVKENIILDNEFNFERFSSIVEICQLFEDVCQMPAGFNQQIAERGQTLSGGQRKRIHLARSLYLDKSIYLLDNPLSSLDYTTQKNFVTSLRKHFSSKTLMITSSTPDFWDFVDQFIWLENGAIKYSGKLNETIRQALNVSKQVSSIDECEEPIIGNVQTPSSLSPQELEILLEKPGQPLILEEDRVYGKVNPQIFVQLYHYYGRIVTFLIVGVFSFCYLYSNLFFQWEQERVSKIFKDKSAPQAEKDRALNYYLWLFPVCVLGGSLFTQLSGVLLAFRAYYASLEIHNRIVNNILFASIQKFYNQTLTSRIINRLSQDIYQFDMNTPKQIAYIFSQTFSFGLAVSSYFSFASAYTYPALFLYILLQIYYVYRYIRINLEVSRLCKNKITLEAISKSPIINNLQESTEGVLFFRNSYDPRLKIDQFNRQLDQYQKTNICSAALSSWYLQRELLTQMCFNILVISINFFDARLSKEAAILSLNYSSSIGESFKAILNTLQIFYNNSVHAERCLNMLENIPQEAKEEGAAEASFNSQQQGINSSSSIVDIRNLSMKYREDSPFVLKSVNFSLKENDKVAIIGRTGCGKTTLMQCITRLIEPTLGDIDYFGQPAHSMSLQEIRSFFSVVSQDPFTFEGSIKENLDPMGQCTSEEIEQVIEKYKLGIIQQLFDLDHRVQNNGRNLSLGQKQLIVLLRTLLTQRKILILDECTGNLDPNYSHMMNSALQDFSKNRSVIAITHRLDQLDMFDTIVLMRTGQIVRTGCKEEVLNQYFQQKL